MARLFEYQGKKLFAQELIPIPNGRVVSSPEEAFSTVQQLGWPAVLKVQTLSGRRGKSGGIVMAGDPREAREKARSLFQAMEPEGLILVEQKMDIQKEIYVSVTADPSARTPVVLLSPHGGIEVEEITKPGDLLAYEVNILTGLSLDDAVNFAKRMTGLNSEEVTSLGKIIHSLYRLYRQYDCKLVEVNPLALCSGGFFAVDARVD
jgi:succinyl-CoA synthetase beta subunit